MITLENNEAKGLLAILEESTPTQRRHVANLIERKIKDAEQTAFVELNKSQTEAIEKKAIEKYLAEEKAKKEKTVKK